MLDDVPLVLVQTCLAPAEKICGAARLVRGVVDSVHDEVEAGHSIFYCHVERGGCGSLLDESSNVEAVGIGSAVDQLVHGAREAMEREDHVHRVGEELTEQDLAHPMRVILGSDQSHQIDDVDYPYAQLGEMLLQHLSGCHGFHGDHVAGAGEHDVGFALAIVVARPAPNAGSSGAVLDGLIDW